jgi:hypothetical protein
MISVSSVDEVGPQAMIYEHTSETEQPDLSLLGENLQFSLPSSVRTHPNTLSIPLSQSVSVGLPMSSALQLVHPLEATYRARYKSDYFPQSGIVRSPRYVADHLGNHCITLQVRCVEQLDLFIRDVFRLTIVTSLTTNRGSSVCLGPPHSLLV